MQPLPVIVDDKLVIHDVRRGGAADFAGLQAGDTLVSLDGNKLSDPIDWQSAISSVPVGQSFQVTVLRDGQLLDIQVVAARDVTHEPNVTPTVIPTEQFYLFVSDYLIV
mgnify:CR=1 FL=1